MAGAGFKTFNTGDVLTASDVNTYLMQQTVMVFASSAARTTALGANVAEGMLSYLKDTDQVEVYNGTSWVASDDPNAIQNTIVDAKGDIITATAADTPARLAVGANGYTLVADSAASTGLRWDVPAGSLANPVINGAFDIWQRGTSIAGSAGSRLYTADRWQMPSNAAQTISRQTTGDTTNLPNIQYCARLQRNASSTDTGNVQIIQSMESANSIPFAGKAITFSFYARRGSNFSATSNAFGFVFNTGTGTDQNLYSGYTGNVETVTNFTATTTWQRFVVNATIPATATEIGYYPYFSPTGTAGANDYLEVTGFQIDLGTYTASTAPAFRRSGGTIQGELAACQRYYFRKSASNAASLMYFGTGYAYAINAGDVQITLPVQMRVTPTAIDYSALADFKWEGTTSANTPSAIAFDGNQNNPYAVSVNITKTAGFTIWQSINLMANATTNAYLGFSAEL